MEMGPEPSEIYWKTSPNKRVNLTAGSSVALRGKVIGVGSRARVSEILNRKRSLTIYMIRKLHAGLGIPAEILIRPYSLQESAA